MRYPGVNTTTDAAWVTRLKKLDIHNLSTIQNHIGWFNTQTAQTHVNRLDSRDNTPMLN